jgi:2,3-diketo-5-methylthio-1-phosphopentane phosphatase
MSCHVFVDFDGTVVPVDTTDALLERFADPSWHAIEEEWAAGRIGSRECMARQIDLVRAKPEQLERFFKGFSVDPGFPAFVRMCRRKGMQVTVVSDGLDLAVGTVLKAAGIVLPYYANRLERRGADRWRLGFPHAKDDCRALSGNCKCSFTEKARMTARIVVGDGRSDFCMSHTADLVLAKGKLAAYAREHDLPHVPITDFTEANAILARWLEERAGPVPTRTLVLGEEQ